MFSVFAETGGRCGSVHEKLGARPGACLVPKGHAISLGPSRRLTSLAAAHEKEEVQRSKDNQQKEDNNWTDSKHCSGLWT